MPQPFNYDYISLIKKQDYVFYSNKINIINFLENNAPTEFYGLLPLDFKKFIKPKKEFTDEELRKLLPKIYYNYIDLYLQKSANTLALY